MERVLSKRLTIREKGRLKRQRPRARTWASAGTFVALEAGAVS